MKNSRTSELMIATIRQCRNGKVPKPSRNEYRGGLERRELAVLNRCQLLLAVMRLLGVISPDGGVDFVPSHDPHDPRSFLSRSFLSPGVSSPRDPPRVKTLSRFVQSRTGYRSILASQWQKTSGSPAALAPFPDNI